MRTFFISVLLLVTFVANGFQANVINVTDGDTIKVKHQGSVIKIRLSGIDAPETNQSYGPESRDYLKSIILNKTVSIEGNKKDKYGRIIGDVVLDKIWLNKLLIEEGLAWHYKQYSSDAELADAEKRAQRSRKGLWSEDNPIAPWSFRRGERSHQSNTVNAARTYWLNTKSNVRHNNTCRYYNNTKYGRACKKQEGKSCSICGG